MNYDLLIPLLVTTVVTISGWFILHQFNIAQDRANKRRDLRVQYLIDAYRRLEAVSNREQLTESECLALESSLAEIQLFGTATQVVRAQEFIDLFAQSGNASLDKLLSELRNDLRHELKLKQASGNLKYLRFRVKPPSLRKRKLTP